jgi:hypothetical protein
MSISVEIQIPTDMEGAYPDPQEPISAIAWGDGGLLSMVQFVTTKDLTSLPPGEAAEALTRVIGELDLGDEGAFDNKYWIEANKKWNGE